MKIMKINLNDNDSEADVCVFDLGDQFAVHVREFTQKGINPA